METRNVILGLAGAVFGACVAIWAGCAFSDWRANAQTPPPPPPSEEAPMTPDKPPLSPAPPAAVLSHQTIKELSRKANKGTII